MPWPRLSRAGRWTAADWGTIAVARQAGFRDATTVLELGAGDFSRSMDLARRFPSKHFLSTDYEFSPKADANLAAAEAVPNLDVRALDARKIDVPAESVDFIFSIALMEHIAELEQCLESAHRALRPGGVYFYVQAPFWTCAQGHHWHHDDDRTYDFIPKYSHLVLDRDGMAGALRAGPPPPFDIDECLGRIYDRPDLSRLGLLATKAVVEAGPLTLESWKLYPDRRYDEAMAAAAFPNLLVPARFEELATSGAAVILRKRGGTGSSTVSRLSRRIRDSLTRRTS